MKNPAQLFAVASFAVLLSALPAVAAPSALSVRLTAPSAGKNLGVGSKVKLKAKVNFVAASSNETVSGVEFLLDGQALGSADAAPYRLVFTPADAQIGEHRLTAVVTDSAGARAESAPVVVTVAAPFMDLGGTADISAKFNSTDKFVIKGKYSLFNHGNAPAGAFNISFYLSEDATFDPASDQALGPLIAQFTGRDPDLTIPGLPANTTLSSADASAELPPIRFKVAASIVRSLNLSGKYVLAVIDADNTAGEPEATRANNVIAVQIP